MKASTITKRMDYIIRQIIRNRFDAIMFGTSNENIERLLSLTRNMGYNDLEEELANQVKDQRPVSSLHL